MLNRGARDPGNRKRRQWMTPSMVLAWAALFIALGGSAFAATNLINTKDIAPGAVTSEKIKNGAIALKDLSASTKSSLQGGKSETGSTGNVGASGSPGNVGASGSPGNVGASGSSGSNGANGAAGSNGANGPNGANGSDGTDGTNGTNGINGSDGIDGIDGTIAPLSATAGLTPLLTATPPTVVVDLAAVPAGHYVVLAKTQLSHTGAGDTVDCALKSDTVTIDQVSMKTLPALAAMPVSLQAVTTITSPSHLSVECDVFTASGTANFSSLIAIPTG
jgi:collagen triple helix repeat protein